MINARKPEVLAPVGNFAMLEAAVRSGADAVYLGAQEFSARRGAQNFDRSELKQAAEYCRIRNVKVYLALNIIIKDAELEAALSLAEYAYNTGIDGIIVQDIGLARLIHKYLPELPLHASTQLSVHSVSALPILKKLGFCRVVPAREMSEKELKIFCDAAEKLGIETEVFVHGALCMSVSGQCLLSAFLGSRSGNRGLCAGPCRLPFSVDGGTGFDLSLKDLSLLSQIDKLCDIGVSSFKIEGRMKRPEYVAAAVSACKSAVLYGFVPQELEATLKNVFSRSGFTAGYFEGKIGRSMFGVRTKEDVSAASKAYPQLHNLYRAERRSVKISVGLTLKQGKPVSLTLCDGENKASVTGKIPQSAVNKAANEESLRAGVDKFGGTPYEAYEISVNADEGLFISAGELNELRRSAAAELDKMRAAVKRTPVKVDFCKKNPPHLHKPRRKIVARFENAEQLPNKLSGIDAIIFPLEKDFPDIKTDMPLIVDIPRGIISEQAIAARLEIFKKKGFKTALCGNIAAFNIARNSGFEVMADTGINIYNSESAEAAAELGAAAVLLSNEILFSDAVQISSSVPKGVVTYGQLPLMLFRNCPLKNGRECKNCGGSGFITDRLGTQFPVRCRMGYGEMLNSLPVWLAEKQADLETLDFEVLYFTFETRERVEQVILLYREHSAADVKFTRGLFFRGVL